MGEAVRLRPGVHCAVAGSGEVFLMDWPHSESLGRLADGPRALLGQLADGSRTVGELAGSSAHQTLLDQLRTGGWLAATISHEGHPLYTVVSRRPFQVQSEAPSSGITLSRFAVLRRSGGDMLLESALATSDVRIHDARLLGLLSVLAAGTPCDAIDPLPIEVTQRLVGDLWREGFVVRDNAIEERRLRQWSAHELWFHHKTSWPGSETETGFGGTYWAKGHFEPLPGRRDPFDGPGIDLARPDLNRLRDTDPPFADVLENRRSIRECDDNRPLELDQVAEFLFRCARVRGTAWDNGQEISSRPYPAGGGLHELEIYPVVRRVNGLPAGLYHYDAYEHRLESLPANPPAAKALLEWAAAGTGWSGSPQALFVITARFGRLMWKYEAMGYALMLRHVGVLCQNMYLVATAMGLAPCALGASAPGLFAKAAGLDQLVESSVGAFGLGSQRKDVLP